MHLYPSPARRQNFFASHAIALLVIAGGCRPPAEPSPFELPRATPVVLIVIDTLRADRLGCYGYELDTSPVLDEFAESAFLFENNTTQCNATFPSLTSIFTGLYPKTHKNYAAVPIKAAASEGALVLTERLARAGYYTAGVMSHPFWNSADKRALILRGWDAYSTIDGMPVPERPFYAHAEHTNERLFPILEDYAAEHRAQPLFLWAHYFDPHTDDKPLVYNAPESTRNLFLAQHLADAGLEHFEEELAVLGPRERTLWILKNTTGSEQEALYLASGRALYDAEIRSCDEGLGELFERLRGLGLYDEALIVVMSDHGENMEGEDDDRGLIRFTHKRLFEGVAQTPFMIKLPRASDLGDGARGLRVPALTQNIDLAPTLIQMLDLVVNPTVEGESLVPVMQAAIDGQVATLHERVFIESADHVERAVKDGTYKLIDRGEDAEPLIYDLARDGAELEDLATKLDPDVFTKLLNAIESFRPVETIHVRLLPDAAPYEVELAVDLTLSRFDAVIGAPEDCLSEDGRSFAAQLSVTDEPVEVLLIPRRYNTGMSWSVTRSGRRAVDVLRIGATPVLESAAIPLWSALEAGFEGEPRLALGDAGEAEFEVRAQALEGEAVALELRFVAPNFKHTFTLQDAHGLGALEELPGKFFRALAEPGTGAGVSTRVARRPEDASHYVSVRFDGVSPDPREVALDGLAVREDRLDFAFPHPLDRRLTDALLAKGSADPPPGSIVIWLERQSERGELDTTGLDLESIELLRTLGYAK